MPHIALLCIAAALVGVQCCGAFEVACGSTLKLQHSSLSTFLHSHEVAYGSGSGQQSVTGYPDGDDSGGYWTILGPKGEPCSQGEPIHKGQAVRFFHGDTKKWLHSHNVRSPMQSGQEVSAYGAPSNSDTGDLWTVAWDGSSKTWLAKDKVYFKHKDTSAWLGSSKKTYRRPIDGHYEVVATSKKDSMAAWVASMGVFFPKREPQPRAPAANGAKEDL